MLKFVAWFGFFFHPWKIPKKTLLEYMYQCHRVNLDQSVWVTFGKGQALRQNLASQKLNDKIIRYLLLLSIMMLNIPQNLFQTIQNSEVDSVLKTHYNMTFDQKGDAFSYVKRWSVQTPSQIMVIFGQVWGSKAYGFGECLGPENFIRSIELFWNSKIESHLTLSQFQSGVYWK